MEVQIISRELIKPFSLPIQQREPYRLSLLDQLTPTTYSPIILFYACNKNDSNSCVDRLKRSLSQTLDIYYPFSGRVVDNLVVDHSHKGVPFLEARVNCCLSDFLRREEIESLNEFLPYRPFTKEDLSVPVFACQASIFSCGGIALGFSLSHKLIDAGTAAAFSATWTSISRGDVDGNIVQPALTEASRFFPPRQSFPQNHFSLMERLWFTKANYVTRRFVFDAKAIAMLKALAVKKGKTEAKTISRVTTLSCFIWKCFMSATKAARGLSTPSILVEAVNLRKRTDPPMSDGAIGNNFWWATSLANPTDEKNTELYELVSLVKEGVAVYDSDYTQSLQGEEGGEAISEFCNRLEGLFSSEKPDVFVFTSWAHFRPTQANFGWGAPAWVGVMGKVGPAFMNFTMFVETIDGKGIEAWITLDEQRMSILEHDPNFLAFCSPNTKPISTP